MLLLLALTGLLILAWRRHAALGLGLIAIGVGGLAVCAFLPLGTWLMRPLEDRFPPMRVLPGHIDGIVVLGGAINLDESADRGAPVLNIAAQRMTDFVALARHYPGATLVFTGGDARLFASGLTEADVARRFFAGLGIDPHRIIFERASRNTHENAVFSRRLVHLRPGQRWLLVTSAADMPRAVGCFLAVGWPVIPYPADYHTEQNGVGFFPSLVGGLEQMDWAAHEWIGLLYYRTRGWTPSIFPGPERRG